MSTTRSNMGHRTAHQASHVAAERTPAGALGNRIQTRAYEIFQTRCRGGVAGDAVSDWLQAERELNGSATLEVEAKSRARGEALLAEAK